MYSERAPHFFQAPSCLVIITSLLLRLDLDLDYAHFKPIRKSVVFASQKAKSRFMQIGAYLKNEMSTGGAA